MIKTAFLTHASDILASQYSTLSWSKIVRYFVAKSVDFNVDIPYSDPNFPGTELPNKRTGFLENLRQFSAEQQFEIINELCDEYSAVDSVIDLKQKLISQYGDLRNTSPLDSSAGLIKETKGLLAEFPNVEAPYNSALEKIGQGIYERNSLDDLRLSLELLLKRLLENEKSLENQRPAITEFLKNKGVSPQIANLLWSLIDYYSKYQNEHVKHNDKVKATDVNFILDLTTSFMKQLLTHI